MWEQIRSNRLRSAILVLGIGAIWLLIGYVFGIIISYITTLDLFQGGVSGVVIASVVWTLIILFAYSFGDRMLLHLTGAREIITGDLHRLYDTVEELQIASGLEKIPAIYIIDDPAMNAFATGIDPDKAAIVVTSGLLSKMNRDELQGVIGHEIAHIQNRDVLLMSLCVTFLGAINAVTWLFSLPKRLITRAIPEEELGCFLLTIAMLIVATIFAVIAFYDFETIIGFDLPPIRSFLITFVTIFLAIPAFMLLTPFLAKLIYFAISRRREYLADASSALYTRYPEGLASALEKIANSTDEMLSANAITAPIFIVNPFREEGMGASDITDTHPPISERICILRAMAHASYAEYDRAYREIRTSDKSIIPTGALAAASSVTIREQLPDNLDYIQRVRETTNTLWNIQKYNIVDCDCGTRMRLPPNFKLALVKCPHCGKINQVEYIATRSA
jgi:heat shock protein HtpX